MSNESENDNSVRARKIELSKWYYALFRGVQDGLRTDPLSALFQATYGTTLYHRTRSDFAHINVGVLHGVQSRATSMLP